MAFLDNTGLGTLWGRIKTVFGASFANLVKDSTSVTIKLQNGYGNDLDTVAIPLADSTNSKAGLMSPTEKSKLAGIASGAEVNVQADWNVTDSSSDAFIKNKPTIPSGVSPYTSNPSMDGTASAGSSDLYARGDHVHPTDTSRAAASHKHFAVDVKIATPVGQPTQTVQSWITSTESDMESIWETMDTKVDKEDGKGLSTNDYTTTEKNKLAGIAAGAEVNVNADWNATSGDAQILNKPTIPSAGTGTSYPAMDGTRALGTQAGYARVDHVHPSDSTKVDKVSGKGLSTNDYTTADKTKVGYVDTGKSVVTYVEEKIAEAQTGASKYKGTVGTGGTVTTLPTSGYKQGDYYVVCSEGTYAGESCEVGDMIFANKDYASGAVAADDWDIVQANITAMTTAEINAICV